MRGSKTFTQLRDEAMAILLDIHGNEEGLMPANGVRFSEEEIADLIPGNGELVHRRIRRVPVFPGSPDWPHFTAMVHYRNGSSGAVNQGARKYFGAFGSVRGSMLL